jgi:pyruvyltransferase
MTKTVIINCNNNYVPKAIIALQNFQSYNSDYEKAIIGTTFNNEMKTLCQNYNIKLIEINLSNDFINLDKRLIGKEYPIECFYHFYAYKVLLNSDYIIQIEPDIYTNKKIDIDLNTIPYIAGNYKNNFFIKDFLAIMRDYSKIKKVYTKCNINQYRILSGVKIYNVKGLQKINFYEKIIEYYKKSIEINAQRCGDDCLMVMYQMINPSHVKLLKEDFHITLYGKNDNLKKFNLKKITFFHFGGNTQKYWNIQNEEKLNNMERYFYDNIIEYIYNNFTINFIQKYIPEIYINIDNVKIPFYYYYHYKIDNFGDLITPYLLEKYCNKNDYTFDFSDNNPKIISCGSIMKFCHQKTIVYGSGIIDVNQNIKKGIIKIVRGPLTRNRLLKIGCYCPPVYGDPGLLLPLYYNPTIKKIYKLGIIPHHIHYNTIKKMYANSKNIIVINLINKNIEIVINQILSCNKTISSSLHGLIISDAYNIPNKWVKFNNKLYGDDTKFSDYFMSVNRNDNKYIDCMNYKKIPHNTNDLIKNVNIKFNKYALYKKFFMNKNGITNYTKYLYKKHILNK